MRLSQRELGRRSLHIALGAMAFAVPFLGWQTTALLAASFAVLNAFVLPRLPWTRWLLRPGSSRGEEGRRGLVLYPLCILALSLLFNRDVLGIQVGWLCLALCDGLSPIFAAWLKGPHWPWAQEKRVFPSAAAALVAGATLVALLPIPPIWALSAVPLAMLGESLETQVDDNVTTTAGGALGYILARNLL